MGVLRTTDQPESSSEESFENPPACERCLGGDDALFLVVSDVMVVRVCVVCAKAARGLGLAVKLIGPDQMLC